MTEIRPFDFAGLKKFSKHQIELENALFAKLPFLDSSEEAHRFFKEIFTGDFGKDCSAHWQGFGESTFEEFINPKDGKAVYVILALEPHQEKWVMRIDSLLALASVAQVLGGSEESLQIRSATPIEQGILQYLILKFLSKIRNAMTELGVTALRFVDIVQQPQDLEGVNPPGERGCLLKTTLQLGKAQGSVVIYLPHPLLRGVLLRDRPLYEGRSDSPEKVERLEKIGYIQTELTVELGHVELSGIELAQLEKGDVILFDETMVHLKPQKSEEPLGGRVILRVGEDRSQGLLGEVIASQKLALIKVLDYYGGKL